MKTEATPKMTVLHAPVGVRSIVSSLVAFFIVASSVTFLLDRGQEAQMQTAVEHGRQEMQVKGDAGEEECNWSREGWVYDNVSRPLYSGLKCAFIFPEVACDKYGRKDVMYQHWRWQPHGCDLPRYDDYIFAKYFQLNFVHVNPKVPEYLEVHAVLEQQALSVS